MDPSHELRELADRLRSAADRINTRETPAPGITQALGLARELEAALEGPPRPLWYDSGTIEPRSDRARTHYDAFGPFGGAVNPVAPPMSIQLPDDPNGRVVARVRLSRSYEGPPHGVHGGVVAGLFDDLLGNVQALAPPVGMTGKLEVTYRRVTPIERDLVFEGWVEQNRHRAIVARATCSADGELTAEAMALFIRVDFDEVANRTR